MLRRQFLAGALALAATRKARAWIHGNSGAPVIQPSGFTGYFETTSPRKHNPWQSFADSLNKGYDFAYWPSSDFTQLPAISFVVPTLPNDMHDGTINAGDAWLSTNMDPYVQWAKTHNSVFFLWFDEDDTLSGNHIPAVAVGAGITAGSTDATTYNHYGLLRAMETAYGVSLLNNAATATKVPLGSVAVPDHIVICMEENHSYAQIIGSVNAPYINNTLVAQGLLYTNFFGVSHPSEPNYFAIFTGSTQGITDDANYSFPGPSLGGQMTYSFVNAEAAAYVARMTTVPNDSRQKLIDMMFTMLKSDGTYATLDVLHLPASHSAQSAVLNATGKTAFDGVVHGAPTFTVDRGYATTTAVALAAAPVDWIDTGYDLSLQSGAGQNNASMSLWTNDTLTGSNLQYMIGTTNLYLGRNTGSTTSLHSRGVSATSADYVTTTADSGLLSVIRSASGSVDYYHNATEHTAFATTSASTTGTISYCGVPLASTAAFKFSMTQIAAVVIGQARTAAQELTLYNALHFYLKGVLAAT